MTLRSFIKLFVPPIVFKLKKQNKPIVSQKQILYDYFVDMNFRSKLSFQDLENLSKDYSFEQFQTICHDIGEPNYYGGFFSLLHYSGLKMFLPPKKFTIQHGILYGVSTWIMGQKVDVSLVWSKKIKEMYENTINDRKIIAIGAPFFYSESLLSENQIEQEKKRLGKNLLAFPMHSTYFIDTIYDYKNFIGVLNQQRKFFDNVRVCLYWRDIQKGIDKMYKEEGFECVCCGHMFDMFFLPRLKSLLEIADCTISNGVGSHIGYSVYMNKPHYLVPDDYSINDIIGNAGREEMIIKQNSQNYKEIYDGFINNRNYVIDKSHIGIADKYWGVSDIKQPSQIKEMFESFYIKYVD